jgi:hypothetical protein
MLSPLLFALTPIGAPAPAPAEELGVLDLVSADAMLVARVTDLPGLRQTAARNDFVRAAIEPGGLLEAFGVPVPPIVPLLLSESIPAERLTEVGAPFDSALELVDAVRGDAALFLELQDQSPVFGFVAYLGEGEADFVRAANTLLAANDDTPFEELGNGFLHKIEKQTSENGLPTQHVAVGHGWMAMAGAEEPLRCQALFERLITQIAAGERTAANGVNPAFVEARKNLRVQGQFELLVDLAPLMEMGSGMGSMFLPPEVHEGLGELGVWNMGWAGVRGGIGVGERLDFEFAMNLPDGSGLAQLADLIRPVPFNLLERVPQNAVQVSAADVDVRGMLDVALRIAGDFGPEYADMINGGLDQANAMVGFDLVDEFLGLVGGGVTFTRPDAADASDSPAEEFLKTYVDATDLLLTLEDHEAFEDALVELADFGAAMSEGAFELVASELGEQTVWGLDLNEDVAPFQIPFRLAFKELDGRGMLAFSVDEPGLTRLLGAKPEKNVLSNELLGPILQSQRGLRATIQAVDTAAILMRARDSMLALSGLAGQFDPGAMDELGPMVEVAAKIDDAWIKRYFQGAALTTLERTANGIRWSQSAR